MFGFIRPYKPELRVREVNRFQAVYCGLCHEIKDRYGRLQTYFLSYDMTFFALVIGSIAEEEPKTRYCRCDASPFRKKAVACSSTALTYAADVSVLLVYYKIQDSIRDESGWKRIAAHFLRKLMQKDYEKARQALPELDRVMLTCLGRAFCTRASAYAISGSSSRYVCPSACCGCPADMPATSSPHPLTNVLSHRTVDLSVRCLC